MPPSLFFRGGYGGLSPASLATVVEPLGHRIPLIPPIGEAFVAGDPVATDRWLATTSDPDLAPRYRASLATVAERGVAISMVGPGARADYDRLHDALAESASGTLTPPASAPSAPSSPRPATSSTTTTCCPTRRTTRRPRRAGAGA